MFDNKTGVHEILKPKKWKGERWATAQVKLDGFRVTAFKGQKGQLLMYGKNHRDDLEFLHRFPRLRKTDFYQSLKKLPNNSSVDAEIIVPGGTSSDVATALRDESIPISLITFAIPRFMGTMMDEKGLDWTAEKAEKYNLLFAEWYWYSDLVKKLRLATLPFQRVKEELLSMAKSLNYEGWVLKQTQYRGWFKVKEVQMVDAVITDVVPGQGKYIGLIGALVVSVIDNDDYVPIANVSGMTDAERKELTTTWKNQSLIGQVVEVKYQEVGSKGRLRHPRFSRMRPDKLPEDCTINQLTDNC